MDPMTDLKNEWAAALTDEWLDRVEREATAAPLALLRLRMAQLQAALAAPAGPPREVGEHADALLLKLDHLAHGQHVDACGTAAASSLACLAPWIVIDGPDGDSARAAA
jgi:hypothetical protein